MKKITTIILLCLVYFITDLKNITVVYAEEVEARLYPQNIGAVNLQTPDGYPVAGFGRRVQENVWVPFQFEMPDHTGLVVKEAYLNVVIEALDANGDNIADADFHTDTVEGCGKNGRSDGVVLFGSFPSLYNSGESPLTQKTIKIDLTNFPKIVDVLNNEQTLHIVSEDDHSVIDAWLDVVYAPEAAAFVKIKNAIKIPKPKDAFPQIPAQLAAGNFPAIPVQQATEITFLIEFDVELKARPNNEKGPVNIEVTDFLPPGMTFKRFYAASPSATVTSTANNTITFSPIKLELPDDGTYLKLFPIKIIYSAILNANAEGYQFHQNTASVSIRDIGTGNIILTQPIQGERVTALLPKLQLDKFTSSYSVKAGEQVTFTIVARNEGNIYFQSLDLDAVIPPNVTVDQLSIYPAGFNVVGNRIQWRNFGPLNTGVSEGFSYRVTVNNNTPDQTVLNDLGYATALVPNFAGAGSRRLNATSNTISVLVSNEPVNASINVTLAADPTQGVYPMYINYSSDVTNTGEVELRNVTLQQIQSTKPLAGNPKFPLDLGTLQPNEKKTIKYKGQIGVKQKGDLTDVINASGQPYKDGDKVGNPVTATANTTVKVLSPAITTVTPSSEKQGSSNLLLKIEGINFSPGAIVSFDPDEGIEVIPPESPSYGFVDFTELNYYVNVSSDASLGEYEVFVTNPNNYTGKTSEGDGITITGEAKDPEVTTIFPKFAIPGIENTGIIIEGGNFGIGAKVNFGEADILVKETKIVNSHRIDLIVDILESVNIGSCDIVVTNSDGKQWTGKNVFEVVEGIGSVDLDWDKPVPGVDLAPPTNLTTNFLEKQSISSKIKTGKKIKLKIPSEKIYPIFHKINLSRSVFDDTLVVINEIEPNNSFSQSQIVNGDSSIYIDGNVEVNDEGNIVIIYENDNDDIEDLYKLTTIEPGLEIYLYGYMSDCDLFIFNQPDTNGLFGWSNFIGPDDDEIFYDPELPAGTYYIGVSIFDPDPQGPESSYYALDIFGIFGNEVVDTTNIDTTKIDKKIKSFKVYRSLSENASKTGIPIATVDTNTTYFKDKLQTKQNFYYQVTADYGFGESIPSNESSVILTSIYDSKNNTMPAEYSLFQNYPNPFNPVTTIEYSIPQRCSVEITIYDILGREISSFFEKEKSIGHYNIKFNASNLASGVYFYRMKAGNYIETKKMILLK